MTSTPGTAQLPPRPVTYPGSSAPVGHRLGAGVITAIIASVVVLAAVVTAALVLPGHHGSKPAAPPWPATASQITPPARQPAPGGSAGAAAPPETVTIAGLPITVHPDWEVLDQAGGAVNLRDKDDNAVLTIDIEDSQKVPDVTAALLWWAEYRFNKEGDLQRRPIARNEDKVLEPPLQRDSKQFQLEQAAKYTFDIVTNDGAKTLYGVFVVLVNTSTGRVAFIDFTADTFEDAKAKWPEARTMIESML